MRVTPSGSCSSLVSLSHVNDSLQSPIQLRTCTVSSRQTVEMRVDRPRATCAMHRIGAHVFERRLRCFFREPCARPVGCRSAMASSCTELDLARGEDAGAHRRGHRHEELDVHVEADDRGTCWMRSTSRAFGSLASRAMRRKALQARPRSAASTPYGHAVLTVSWPTDAPLDRLVELDSAAEVATCFCRR